ncbi:radical SAM protein [Heliobacterium gestii]|uniref:FeMo cofactor biosynthesis protein NifB n=1 Tax=Heliomicrobium gestii TaxID=2699 RepID=A0A845LMJ9_HELGE|nr:radical SAM protein [Heliomicrobium gestii]MBM7868428.1 nitrogen fixation protein NifB [Heliomicrobium gestii]MZP44583.1 radical SAM protein [Heliomicrobium gestii]
MGCLGSCEGNQKESTVRHPCFSPQGHGKAGRIHLPVAPSCNIGCGYCVRKFDCANESRPGVTSRVITPEQALWRVEQALASDIGPYLNVVGIAGPGEPLANENTFKTFRLLQEHHPHLISCVSSNGLLLADRLADLVKLNVSHVTVTMNTLDPAIGARIYRHVIWQGQRLTGEAGAALLIERQLLGIQMAADAGLTVKVNTVVIPGLNDDRIEDLAREVKRRGAALLNLMPLINQGDFADWAPPTPATLQKLQQKAAAILPQLAHCRQCRADAIGLI